ncbi:MAG: hypothetical protein MSC50_05590 [Campylobacter sp.]|nr:hypothetical protein [Campylobacter sp.]
MPYGGWLFICFYLFLSAGFALRGYLLERFLEFARILVIAREQSTEAI